MALKIIIKDDSGTEHFEYTVNQFTADFATEAAKQIRPWWGKTKKSYFCFKIAEDLIRNFKKKTIQLSGH